MDVIPHKESLSDRGKEKGSTSSSEEQLKQSQCEGSTYESRPTAKRRSPVPSCMSMESDQSGGRFITFDDEDNSDESQLTAKLRSKSPVPSCVSMKSDQSGGRFITFQHEDNSYESQPTAKRRSPVPSNVSMKSDQSGGRFITFDDEDISDESQAQKESFDNIFQVLENKIISFVKKKLKRFKSILSPDYQEAFKHDDDDDDADGLKEGVLKIVLYFLRNMEQKHLADKLQENELNVVCQRALKRNLKRKYQSVFEGIPQQGSSTLLEKIYTDIYIMEGGSGKVNEEHEVRQIELRSKKLTGQETSIKCKDIFKPLPGQGKPIKTVVTKGVGGIGKTISVQKYILDWAEGRENQNIHFIFPLAFRELNLMKDEQHSLEDILHRFFTEIKQLSFPSQANHKVLFILDGLDECRLQLDFQKNKRLADMTEVTSLDVLLTNLIKGSLFPSALLWITSRPAAANQIPPECVDRITEAKGFSDEQKEEYFRKRISDQNLAERVISHIKCSRSLHIMCHIPVFCWIAVSILGELLGSGSEHIPKTLTEMYTYFLIFQTKQRNIKFENVHGLDLRWNQDVILALGKLAYEQLEKGNLIFYEEDLTECGIDVSEAAVYSGICTQMFREESGHFQGKVFSFIHLSIQEYLAALYFVLMLARRRKNFLFRHQIRAIYLPLLKWTLSPYGYNCEMDIKQLWSNPKEEMLESKIVHKRAVDKALKYEDGRFDLFLRFLLGLSLESNQTLLHGLLQRGQNQMGNDETIRYIKDKIREFPTSERVINLFHCLNELHDHSLVKEVQSFLSSGSLSESELSPAQWSALVFVLLTSEEKLDVFVLNKYIKSDEGLLRLLPIVEESEKALLNSCDLTERSCQGLESVLSKASSKLKDLDLSGNSIGDTGVQNLCAGLMNPNCALETLKLSDCSITEKGYTSLASALKSNPSHLRELDLSGNNPGTSGVKMLLDLKEDPQCRLETVRFLKSAAAEEACAAVASAVGSNPLLMTELDLSKLIPGHLGVTQLCALLEDSHCRLQKLSLSDCSIAEEGFRALVSALRSNPSHMKELQLSGNKAGDSGMKHLSSLLEDPKCNLKKLILSDCHIKEYGYARLASALRLNPNHLRELDLRGNDPGESGVRLLFDLLEDLQCQLQKVWFLKSSPAEEACAAVTLAVGSNPLLMTELDLSKLIPGHLGLTQLCALLEDSHCRLQTLSLSNCSITEEGFSSLAFALRSNPSHIRELLLSGSQVGDSGVKHLCSLLEISNCKLEKLDLDDCSIAEEGFSSLASALRSNPSHIRELQLSGNEAGDSGVKYLSNLLRDPNFKLEKLQLSCCSITEEGFKALASALRSNPSHIRELQLRENKAGDSEVKHLSSLLEDLNCKLEKLELSWCRITEEGFRTLASALRSNPSYIRQLLVSGNKAGDSGVKHLSSVLENPNCKLEKLQLSWCSITEGGFKTFAQALRSNPLHIRELQLSGNEAGDSGVKHLSCLLEDPNCKLQKLHLSGCSIAEEGFSSLASALKSNPLHIRELQLSGNEAGDSGVKHLSSLLEDPNSKLEKLHLHYCNITREGFSSLASALRSNPSHIRELQMRGNNAGDSGAKHLSSLLENPNCKLEKLDLYDCSITEEGFRALASALRLRSSHMRELQLSFNEAGDSGVKHFSSLLQDPHCRLEKLDLSYCSVTDEGFRSLPAALRSNPSALKELWLGGNQPGPSALQLFTELQNDSDCKNVKIYGLK